MYINSNHICEKLVKVKIVQTKEDLAQDTQMASWPVLI